MRIHPKCVAGLCQHKDKGGYPLKLLADGKLHCAKCGAVYTIALVAEYLPVGMGRRRVADGDDWSRIEPLADS